jgi:stage II sporulation protein GA (sporulation sigma-E factor processing peptidase)
MTVIYIDSVFCLNTVTDYFLLLVTAKLAGIPLCRKKYCVAAILGGMYAAGCFFPGGAFLAQTPVKAAVGVLIGLIAYGGEERLARLIVLLFLLSCGLAGCVLALGLLSGGGIPAVQGIFYTDIDARVLLVSVTAFYFILSAGFRACGAHGIHGRMLSVRLRICGKMASFSALYDTGNGLLDPVSGKNILVLSRNVWKTVLPCDLVAEVLRRQTPEEQLLYLHRAAPQLSPRLLPYRTAGSETRLLLTVRVEDMEIGGISLGDGLAALLPVSLDVPALWGGQIGKDGKDGGLGCCQKISSET